METFSIQPLTECCVIMSLSAFHKTDFIFPFDIKKEPKGSLDLRSYSSSPNKWRMQEKQSFIKIPIHKKITTWALNYFLMQVCKFKVNVCFYHAISCSRFKKEHCKDSESWTKTTDYVVIGCNLMQQYEINIKT